MKSLVFSYKGGVGKSTIAYHVLLPYLFQKNNQKQKIIDVDSVNAESDDFQKSQFIEKIIKIANESDMKKISYVDPNIIVDVGSTLAETYLEYMLQSDWIYSFDYVFIPITSKKKDAEIANYILKKFQDLNSKVFLVLNMVEQDEIFEFPYVFGGDYFGAIESVFDTIPNNFVQVPFCSYVNLVSSFGITLIELAQKIDLRKQRELREKYAHEKNEKKVQYCTAKILAKKNINSFYDFLENHFYAKL